MKRYKRLAICAMAVLAMTLAMGSCKKETQNNMTSNAVKPAVAFNPSHINDMDKYLKDFKKKMQESVYSKDNETMPIDEAAWHLSSVANHDFANANVDCANILFDTVFTNIKVTNDEIAISDLGAVYSEISNAIDEYYQNLTYDNKHFRFIGASISEEGVVTIPMIITYDYGYHIWYPSDTIYCDMFFSNYTSYPANGLGMTTLEQILNLIESRPTDPESGRTYYVITRTETPYFADYIDPYGSPNFMNSRIFCTRGYFYADIHDQMCYYLCSYHELGLSLLYPGLQNNEYIVKWDISWETTGYKEQRTGYHNLCISYGYPVVPTGGGGFGY